MFLTRMSLDVNRPDTIRALSDPAELDRAVRGAFGGVEVPCLWRVDVIGHRTYLLLFSPIRTTLEPVHERYGYLGCFPSWETEPYHGSLERLTDGLRRSFRVVLALPHPGLEAMDRAEQLRTIAQCGRQEQLIWLTEQSPAWGFRVEQAEATHSETRIFRPAPDAPETVLHCVAFEGILQIRDAALFRQSLCNGIGPEPHWGCGLMTVDEPGQLRHV